MTDIIQRRTVSGGIPTDDLWTWTVTAPDILGLRIAARMMRTLDHWQRYPQKGKRAKRMREL